MGSEDVAVGGDQGSFVNAETAGEESAGVAVGDEADVVGVGLGGHREAAALGFGAYIRLGGGVAEREEGPGQALAAGDRQDVGLILGRVGRTAQRQAGGLAGAAGGGAAGQAGVVAGGDGVKAEGEAALQEGVELDPLVAAHAGVGGATGAVFVEEVGDDALLELLGQVPHVEGNAEDFGGPAGIGGVLNGAAAARARACLGAIAGEGHVHPDDVVSGVHGARSGDGGVHSAGQCREHAHGGSCGSGMGSWVDGARRLPRCR